MYASVKDIFWSFSGAREGVLDYMYTDKLNLVTTGTGNLIDSGPRNSTVIKTEYMAPALRLPWRRRANAELASQSEIAADWTKIKLAGVSQIGGGNQRGMTSLYLDKKSMDSLKEGQLSHNETILRSAFPNWDNLPADAQLGILSMAWAAGPYFYKKFPRFTAAVNSGDFVTASRECHMAGLNADRQDAQELLFKNAASVLVKGADKTTLYWPNAVVVKAGVGMLGSGVAIGAGIAAYHILKRWI